MIERDQLERSKVIQRRTGRTFHFATRLLPKHIRHATYVLYAFFRIADDIVDDPDPPLPDVQRRRLERIRREALGKQEASDPVLDAFQDLRDQYDIPDREVDEFIAAMKEDATARRYETYSDLEKYLRGSSVAVAYMMVSVMRPEDAEQARPHAKALGEAFQLTNFLRDVREDILEYGRIYLPRSTLERHGATDEQIQRLEYTDGFAAAMRTELERTETLYWQGIDGISYLPEGCQFAVLLAAVLYADHHRLIREQDYDVLSNRPSLSMVRRIELLSRTGWHWYRTGNPRSTFETVSTLESSRDKSSTDQGIDDREDNENEHGYTFQVERLVGSIRSLLSLVISQ
jgi:phytoene synthase